MGNFAENFIRGFMLAGQQQEQDRKRKTEEEDRAHAKELRKFQINALRLKDQQDKIEDAERARKSGIEEFNFQGQLPDEVVPGFQGGKFQPEPPEAKPLLPGAPPVPVTAAPISANLEGTLIPKAPVAIPAGGYGQPGEVLTPRSRASSIAEMLALTRAEAQAKHIPPRPTPVQGFTKEGKQQVSWITPEGVHSTVPTGAVRPEPAGTEIERALERELGRKPTSAELAKAAGNKVSITVQAGEKARQAARRGSLEDMSTKTQERVRSVAQRAVRGELTTHQAMQMLGGVQGGLGMAFEEAASEQNASFIPNAIRVQLDSVDTSLQIIDKVSQMVEAINRLPAGDVKGRTAQAKLLEDYVSQQTPLMARAVGHVGVLTQQDVDSVKGLIPGWKSANFAPEFAREKIRIMRDRFMQQKGILSNEHFRIVGRGGEGSGAAPDLVFDPITGKTAPAKR